MVSKITRLYICLRICVWVATFRKLSTYRTRYWEGIVPLAVLTSLRFIASGGTIYYTLENVCDSVT